MDRTIVLLADDHSLMREGTDGQQAVKLVMKLQPNLALMDIAIPKLNGIEAT